jgi:kumamolisin
VAGNADPSTGYLIRVDGRRLVVGGTSSVAPLWAGLTSLLNQNLGTPAGFINPALYQFGGETVAPFRDITDGSNGAYSAGRGWDPCTGWGSPSGAALLSAFHGLTQTSATRSSSSRSSQSTRSQEGSASQSTEAEAESE